MGMSSFFSKDIRRRKKRRSVVCVQQRLEHNLYTSSSSIKRFFNIYASSKSTIPTEQTFHSVIYITIIKQNIHQQWMFPRSLCTLAAGQTLSFRFSEVHCRRHRAAADGQEEEEGNPFLTSMMNGSRTLSFR
ncbi:hypothetical protein CDAR_179111 [Caerostris darwini]|uniref:Uncharacterized protein n=1 Tax=Caerostris darwini TaxID=1538125 RepID=A0AAV4PB75_9ARAC|nr:hypothetical protein CDAR_179111 [Caerostris darwini]